MGNVLEWSSLDKARVREASAVVLALSDDGESVFATAVVRDYAPEVPLIVRVLRTPNTPRIYRSGADFAISVGQVAGQILAYHLLGEQTIHVENRVKFIRLNAAKLREREVLVEFGDGFEVRADDTLFVCGSVNSLERYQQEFEATSAPEAQG